MMIHDKKKAMQTIMARRSEKGGERTAGPAPMKSEVTMTEPGVMDGRHAAAQDVIAAMYEKSPEKMSQAMANFMDMHISQPSAPDSPGE